MSEKEPSLRDQVEAAYEAAEETHVEPEQVEPEVPESVKEDAPSEKQESVEKEPEQVIEDDPEAPSNWSPEDVEAFNELDDRGKKLYLKRHKEREASYTKKFQALAEDRRLSENFKKVMGPHEEHLRSIGVDPLVAVTKLLDAEKFLRNGTPEQKFQALQKIAQDYGVNFYLPQQHNSQEPQQQYSPETLALLQEVKNLNQRQQIIEQDRVQREYYELAGQIEKFKNAKDEKGQPKYPEFENLRQDMGKRVEIGMAKNLEDAYEQSFWANEDLRQQYINMQYNNRMKEADVLKKTVASKKAGFNVKGSGGSSAIEAPSDNLTRRQIIEKAYASQERRQRI